MKALKMFLPFVVFALLYMALRIPYHPSDKRLAGSWRVEAHEEVRAIQLPFYTLSSTPETFIFSTDFEYTALDSEQQRDTLVIPRMSCHALAVSVNGIQVYQVGDLKMPTANIWNSSHLIPLNSVLQEGRNSLEIHAAALYDAGLHAPPFLARLSSANSRINFLNFMNNDFILLSIGASLILGTLLIWVSFTHIPLLNSYIFLGIALILGAVYNFEFQWRLTSGTLLQYFWGKKLILSCAYFSSASFLLAIEKYVTDRIKYTWPSLIFTGIAIMYIVLSPDFFTLRQRMDIGILLIVLNAVFALTVFFWSSARIWERFAFPIVFLALSLLDTALSVLLKKNTPFMIQYGGLISCLSFGAIWVRELSRLVDENQLLHRQSNTDPLTGAYNRSVLAKLHFTPDDMLVMIDLDRFKYYNDTYGHQKGDKLLKLFCETVKACIREDDLLLRYGGDEFIIVIRKNHDEHARLIVERIKERFHRERDDERVDFSYGIHSLKGGLSQSLQQADELMYRMKRRENKER